jgi:hypothetical protein
MSSAATPGFTSLTQLIELQQQVRDLFDQDYELKFHMPVRISRYQDFGHALRPEYLRAHMILRWIMGIGSDQPVLMLYEHWCLRMEARDQFDEFLFTIKDELPEVWRQRATSIYISL